MLTLSFKQRIAELGLAGRAALLLMLFAGLWLLSLPLAICTAGSSGVLAAFCGAMVVWFASAAGLAIGEMFYGTHQAILKLLFGMVIRMFIPLLACLGVLLTIPQLASAGFVFYVLGFYLLALPVDTVLAVLQTAAAKEAAKPNGLN